MAEQLVTVAKTTQGSTYDLIRKEFLIAQHIFPLEDRFTKTLAYADLFLVNQLDPAVTIADLQEALKYDPYAPDLLQGLMWVLQRSGRRSDALLAAQKLWDTERCIDCWLKVQ